VTFLLSALCLLPIQEKLFSTAPRIAEKAANLRQDLLVGMRFVFKERPVLRSLLVTTVFYTLGASAFIYVLPLFVNDHLKADPVWLGWLWSAMGAGMLLTSVGLSCVKNLERNGRILLMGCSMVLGGSALQVLAHSHSVVWGFILVAVIGASTAAFTPIAWSIIQETTPTHLMGRVFTLVNTASMAMASGGMVAFGGVADTFGSMAGISMISLVFLVTGGAVVISHRFAIQGHTPLTHTTRKMDGHVHSLSRSTKARRPVTIVNSMRISSSRGWTKTHDWILNCSLPAGKIPDDFTQRISRAPP
jgi:MFS transporter, DHA3 family, macrolide efflux protein